MALCQQASGAEQGMEVEWRGETGECCNTSGQPSASPLSYAGSLGRPALRLLLESVLDLAEILLDDGLVSYGLVMAV